MVLGEKHGTNYLPYTKKASRNTVDSKVLFETDFTMTSTGKNILSVSMTNAVHF